MQKNIFRLVLLISVLQTLYACCRGDQEPDIYSKGFSFSLVKKQTQQNLLGLYGIYHKDTVKIYDEIGQKVYNGPVPPDGYIYFLPVRKDKDNQAFATEVTRKFYLYLDQYDTDTIKIAFKLKQIRECGKRDDIDYTKIYYNDSLYVSGNALSYSVFLK
jgi:hypothetical protein